MAYEEEAEEAMVLGEAIADYKHLRVWTLSKQIAGRVCRDTSDFPREEMYGLVPQTCRAAASVPSNLAEGHSRPGFPDDVRHDGPAAEIRALRGQPG